MTIITEFAICFACGLYIGKTLNDLFRKEEEEE